MFHYDNIGYCVDDPDNSTTNGTLIQIWQCNSKPQQQMAAVNISYGGYWQYYEIELENGKCLDDPHDSTTNGTRIQIYTCLNDASQAWYPYVVNGVDEYINANGLAIDLKNNSNTNGNAIQVWQSLNDNAQNWCGPTPYCGL
jgi:hypothetical protein